MENKKNENKNDEIKIDDADSEDDSMSGALNINCNEKSKVKSKLNAEDIGFPQIVSLFKARVCTILFILLIVFIALFVCFFSKQQSTSQVSESTNDENIQFDANMMDVLEPEEKLLYVFEMAQNALKRGDQIGF